MKKARMTAWMIVALCVTTMAVRAGSLDPTNAPGPAMKSLEEIYNKLADVERFYTDGGDATPGEVLSGKTAWVDGEEITGTMPDRAGDGFTPGTSPVNIPAGYYNGSGVVGGDADLVAGNVRAGVTLFGVEGKTSVVNTVSGDAVADDIRAGRIGWVNGVEVVGSIPDQASRGFQPATTNVPIPAGYYDGTGVVSNDANLVAANIRSGATIFGVAGQSSIRDTETASGAGAGQIVEGRVGWVNGVEVTGTMTNHGARGFFPGASDIPIPEGWYSGSGVVTGNANLVSGNIRAGKKIFGATGSHGFKLPRTGQTSSIQVGDDAWWSTNGVGRAWPATRFTNNGDNTVTDHLTGLMWARAPHSISGNGSQMTFDNAVDFCEGLTFATYSDWRLPNVMELVSLLDYSITSGVLLPSGHPFSGINNNYYSASTTYAKDSTRHCIVHPGDGDIMNYQYKTVVRWVWPVRGGM